MTISERGWKLFIVASIIVMFVSLAYALVLDKGDLSDYEKRIINGPGRFAVSGS